MKSKQVLAIAGIIVVCIAASGRAQTPSPPALSAADKQVAEAFEKRAKDYARMREALEAKMPALSKEAKAEEIQAHKTQFQERVRAARAGSKPGDIFTPEAARHIPPPKSVKDISTYEHLKSQGDPSERHLVNHHYPLCLGRVGTRLWCVTE